MSLKERLLDSILEDLGVSREVIKKTALFIENIDIKQSDDEVEISVDLKNVTIKIKK